MLGRRIGRFGEIHAPTLVVVGDLDMPGIQEIADSIDNNVEGAEVIVMPGVSHMVNLERPDEIQTVIALVPNFFTRDDGFEVKSTHYLMTT